MRSLTLAVGALVLGAVNAVAGAAADDDISKCEGYSLGHVTKTPTSIEADLDLIGSGCGIYGPDIPKLSLLVEYQAGQSIPLDKSAWAAGRANGRQTPAFTSSSRTVPPKGTRSPKKSSRARSSPRGRAQAKTRSWTLSTPRNHSASRSSANQPARSSSTRPRPSSSLSSSTCACRPGSRMTRTSTASENTPTHFAYPTRTTPGRSGLATWTACLMERISTALTLSTLSSALAAPTASCFSTPMEWMSS